MAKRTKNNKGGQALIIVLAIVAVAVIIYLAFFRKAKAGTAEGYIDRLDVSSDIKKTIKGYLFQAQAEQDINANMAANPGLNYEQALALTAAYYLVPGTVDDATWQRWKEQIKAMKP